MTFQMSAKVRRMLFAYALLFPAMAFIMGVLGYGVVSAFVISLRDVQGFTPEPSFVGIENYIRLFRDRYFLNAVERSVLFVAGSVALGMFIALVGGWHLYRIQRFRNAPRALSLIPYLVSGIAVAVTWRFIFVGEGALVTTLLESVGVPPGMSWLGDRDRALLVVILAHTWRISPFAMLVMLSGYQSLDQSLLDCAEVDGATGLKRFRLIILPLVAPMAAVSLIWLNFASFNMFNIVMAMTGGGPARGTELMPVHLYKLAFEQLNYSSASAVMIILLLINTAVSLLSLKAAKL